ncbi:MAG: hypothetical protein JWL61_933 [Gemmatimonadetes bacterium]|nr:hypothetical protein [Gemmatimonadota bacterium]
MGAEAKTTLKVGRQTFAGTAHLESTELRFRGEASLRIPLTSVSEVVVKKGALHITHANGVAVLALGDLASEKWAERIRSPRSLADKLGVKSGMSVAVLGMEDEAILADLASRGAALVADEVPANCPLVLWRVTKPAALSKLSSIGKRIARDGAIWVIHPRGDASVADTVIFAAGKDAGLTATKVVRFSETDTAEKLVIPRVAR